MSWDFIRTSDIKHTRKEHECLMCGRTIPIGKPAYNWRGLYDGEFQNSYACMFCIGNDIGTHGEELSDCEFNDWIYEQDFMQCQCGNRYHSYWYWVNNQEDVEIECEECGEKHIIYIGWGESENKK